MKISKINISDTITHQRLDVTFHNNKFNFKNFVSLSKYVEVKGGKRIPKNKTFSSNKTNYFYLRLTDIDNLDVLNYNNFKYIDKELFNKLSRYEINENELAISIAGTIGKIILIKNIPINKRIILSENCARLIVKDKKTLSEYIKIILNLSIVQNQIQANKIETTIQKIGLEKIKKLQIPITPSLETQKKIINIYNRASNDKNITIKNSALLLNKIKTFLIKELKIKQPLNNKGKLSYSHSLSDILGKTMDVKSINIIDNFMYSEKYKEISLDKICVIKKGQSITKNKINPGLYPVIAGGQKSPYSHHKYNEDKNVITISASGAYAGFVSFHDYKIFASDCLVIRSKNESIFSTKYIYEILKLKQTEIYSFQRGSGQPHVYANQIKLLSIPRISIKKQNDIDTYILEIRNEAQRLQDHSDEIIKKAKNKIESLIFKAL